MSYRQTLEIFEIVEKVEDPFSWRQVMKTFQDGPGLGT